MLFTGWIRPPFAAQAASSATRENAAAVLGAAAVTIVFPGGDYDSFRPTRKQNVIDFAGRRATSGRAAADVPIVAVVDASAARSGELILLARRAAGGVGCGWRD